MNNTHFAIIILFLVIFALAVIIAKGLSESDKHE